MPAPTVGNAVEASDHRVVQQSDEADVQAALEARITALNEEPGWPWQRPGAVSVSLDDQDQIVECVADDDGHLVVTRVLGQLSQD